MATIVKTSSGTWKAGEHKKAQIIIRHLGKYSLAALNAEIVAQFRDTRLAGDVDKNGKLRPRSNNTVRLELALLGQYTAGLEDFRFHDLRHEAVSRFVEAGLSDQEVSAISGHKSMQRLKRYTHLCAEDLVQKLDRITATTTAAAVTKDLDTSQRP